MAVGRQPLLNSSPIGLRAIADRPPGPVRITAYGARRLNPAGFFSWQDRRFNCGLRKGRRRFEMHARRRFGHKLGHSNPQHPIKSNVCAKLRRNGPTIWEEIVGAATLSRFVSTIPRERCIRLSATTQVPKAALSAAWLHNDLAHSVQY